MKSDLTRSIQAAGTTPPALTSRERDPDEEIKGMGASGTTAPALPPPKDEPSGRA